MVHPHLRMDDAHPHQARNALAPAIEMRQLLLKLLSPMDSFCCGPALGNASPKHGRMVVMVWDF